MVKPRIEQMAYKAGFIASGGLIIAIVVGLV